MAVHAFTHVPRRDPAPHDIGEVRRDVIERFRVDERLVRRRQQREARSEARAENADAVVALHREPCNRAPRVEHGLPAHLHRARDVGRHDVVGAMELRRHALIVIGQAETQRAHPVPVQQPAQTHVGAVVGVPLRKHEHGRAWNILFRARFEVPAIHRVVFRMRRGKRRRKREQPIAVGRCRAKGIFGRRLRREEPIGVGHHRRDPVMQICIAAGNPVESPVEITNDAVGGHRSEAAFPGVEDGLQHRATMLYSRAHAVLS